MSKNGSLQVSASAPPDSARVLYQALLTEPLASESRSAACAFLDEKLEQAARLPDAMPLQPDLLAAQVETGAVEVGKRYASYLESRKAGQARRYFSSRSHALSFLQQIAPTKLVDGAWLYGVLQHWQDDRFHSLIRTYLEELGDGDPAQNHVVLYKRLLARHGCDQLPELSDEHYVQGALQLALGCRADRYMPELIGYNLGYEQLPLHLLISAFELDELGIDPYYFTLHVTIDNASTGHAHKAVQSLLNTMPAGGDSMRFLERAANGYRLNELGLGVNDVVDSFDLEQELVTMLERKSVLARNVHSDYCSIEGRTVNEWLSDPRQIRDFLQALTDKGWIKRHQDPENSRFWRLVEGNKAPMFGVFSAFEGQLLYDWIAGDWLNDGTDLHAPRADQGPAAALRPKTVRHRRAPGAPQRLSLDQTEGGPGDIDHDVKALERELAQLPDALRMQRLIRLMAPATHSTARGLMATRLFAAALQ